MPIKVHRVVESSPMVEEKSWEEFRSCGMLWATNRILHLFGWAIAVAIEANGNISRVYPIRTKFRGFDAESETKGFQKVTAFMADNADELRKEAFDA